MHRIWNFIDDHLIAFLMILMVALIVFAVVAGVDDHKDCAARGGVIVYSTPIAGGVPLPTCVAAPPGALK